MNVDIVLAVLVFFLAVIIGILVLTTVWRKAELRQILDEAEHWRVAFEAANNDARAAEERERRILDWIALAAASEPTDWDPAPDTELEAVLALRREGATWKDLADILGVSERTVRRRVERALEAEA